LAQIHLTTKNEMNVIGYISFLIKLFDGYIKITTERMGGL